MFFSKKDRPKKTRVEPKSVRKEEIPASSSHYKEAHPRTPTFEDIGQAVREPIREPTREAALFRSERETAPLFVKVEKYRGILASLQDIKSFVYGVKQLLTVLGELESVRSETVNLLRATVQRIEKNALELDNDFLRPKGVDLDLPVEDTEISHLESSLGDLQNQLSSLRKELQEFK